MSRLNAGAPSQEAITLATKRLRRVYGPDLAEEAVHDAIVKTIEKQPKNPDAYFNKVARTNVLHELRRQDKEQIALHKLTGIWNPRVERAYEHYNEYLRRAAVVAARWRAANPEKARASSQKQEAKQKLIRAAKRVERIQLTPEQRRMQRTEQMRRYRANHPEWYQEQLAKDRERYRAKRRADANLQ